MFILFVFVFVLVFVLKPGSSDSGNEKAHNVFLGGITVIIRITGFALFYFTVHRSEPARESLVSLLVSLTSQMLLFYQTSSPSS